MKTNLSILLIEDNPDHADLIIRSLPTVKVTQVKNHAQCFNQLKSKKFDLILMDYIEEKSNIQFIRDLKLRYFNTPLIVITGQGDEQTAAKSIKAGADEYLVKTRESLHSLPKIISRTLKKTKEPKAFSKKNKNKISKRSSLWHLFKDFEKISKSLRLIYKQMGLKKGKEKSKKK